MWLRDRVAVVYGAAGAIGGAISRAFAREGARVFLSGRAGPPLRQLAGEIRDGGGVAEPMVVDALDEAAVTAHVDRVVAQTGRVDVSCNVIGYADVQRPLTDLSVEDFLQPVVTAARTQFLTTRAAARHMLPQGSGVVLTFGGGGPQTLPGLGGFKVALDAVESLRRQWAVELGPSGIRVVSMKSGGVAEGIPESFPGREEIAAQLREATLLGRTATLADVGNVAAFLASDLAASITGTEVNISCGAIVD